jgi:hypothetical protein
MRKLKQLLGDRYRFTRCSEREIRNLRVGEELTAAVLLADCVKMEATAFCTKDGVHFLYDVYVKDRPDSKEWICFDSPEDDVVLKERAMVAVLHRVVTENDLSYTECRFATVAGKPPKEPPASPCVALCEKRRQRTR